MKTKNQAFTLVEILIVVTIFVLLAAMAVPAFRQIRQQEQNKHLVLKDGSVTTQGNNTPQYYRLDVAIEAFRKVAPNESLHATFILGGYRRNHSVTPAELVTYSRTVTNGNITELLEIDSLKLQILQPTVEAK